MDDESADTGVEASAPPRVPAPESSPAESLAPFTAEAAAEQQARNVEFTLFYTNQMPALVAFLIVQGARSTVAGDVAQDAMTEAFRNWDSLDNPRAWVRIVASRTWWRTIGRDRKEGPSEGLDEHAIASTSAELDEVEARHEFLRILHSLPPGQRQVMAWTYDGYQPTEIATLLGKTPAAIRSLLRDARSVLRRQGRGDGVTP
jgi:RNA polymerase sigma-70 factor (ECF subfamily)